MDSQRRTAKLILEDGSVFQGIAFGALNGASGEVVFNTGMVGYPESLSDPSYFGQILVFTYPLIGNYGVPTRQRENGLLKYFESEKIQVKGLVLTDYSDSYCHWNAEMSLSQWMTEHQIPGIYGIDTRKLTKKLRKKGTMLGKIIHESDALSLQDSSECSLVQKVSITKPVIYEQGDRRIVLIDCGVKNSIIQAFLRRKMTVIRIPWDYDFLEEKADGILISNGPGDPKQWDQTINHIRRAFSRNIPILGICLGSQILGLAAGADTYKLKYGHRSQNQPCIEVGTNRCYITSQNHGYAVDTDTLGPDWREWFFNQNDQTNEGIIHMSRPFFGTQFHPEASPGPDDTEFIFDLFLRALS